MGEVQVNVPFSSLKGKYLPFVIESRMNPEIGIDDKALDGFCRQDFDDVARLLHQKDLSITLHAPFMDMVPGSPDPLMRKTTVRRLRQAFDLLPIFEPRTIVCHTGFDSRRYPSHVDRWIEASAESWLPLLGIARETGTRVMFENVYESTPDVHLALLSRLESPQAGFCFDVGHWHVFSEAAMGEWLEKLQPFLGQVHLHDNLGDDDAHQAVGSGSIDFQSLFSILKHSSPRPVVTLEPHREEDLMKSIEAIKTLWPW